MQTLQKADTPNRLFENAFDEVASTYQEVVNVGLSVTGEKLDYFARERVNFLKQCLKVMPTKVLDFGCGTGTSTPLFFEILGAKDSTGIDQSLEALEEAKRKGFRSTSFQSIHAFKPQGNIDLAYANTVFHHIPLDERANSLKTIYDSLRPGGCLAFWENNPWNPGTHWVMSRIPFDHDAIMLNVFEATQLLRRSGFEVLRTDFKFIFPGALKIFRPIEKWVQKLPLGGQYQILAMKPARILK